MFHIIPERAPRVDSAGEVCAPPDPSRARPTGSVPSRMWEKALFGPLQEFLGRPSKQFRARLVRHAWRLAGRPGEPPPELPLLVEWIHAGSLIVDDIEDGSLRRRGRACLHRLVGVPLALNTGNWLYFSALTLLQDAGLDAETERTLYRLTTTAMRRCHEGQALDLRMRVGELAQSEFAPVTRAITEQKTGALMGLAAAVGAVTAGATPARCAALVEFGARLGVGLQMQNDLANLHPDRLQSCEDLLLGRVTWPWAWLAEDLPADRFAALQGRGIRLADDGGDAERLAADLRDALGPRPPVLVRDCLRGAVDTLARALGPSAGLDELEGELSELEGYHV